MFPNSSGAVAGVVGGVGTVGGIVYPLVYAAPMMPSLHTGYSVVAATMIPILLLCAWVFQPRPRRTGDRRRLSGLERRERYLRGTDRRLSAEKPSLTGPENPTIFWPVACYRRV